MAQNISVPDIGDFKDVEVIEVLVKPGDQINKNDPIVTIESDKSSLEIPSPSSGEIKGTPINLDRYKLINGYLVGYGVNLYNANLKGVNFEGIDVRQINFS